MTSLQLLQRLVLAFSALSAQSALADDGQFPRVWLNPGFFTHHFKSGDFREDNYGPGVEVPLSHRHALLGGSFINRDRERSRYVGYYWRPWQHRVGPVHLSGGLVVGAIDGYSSTNDGANLRSFRIRRRRRRRAAAEAARLVIQRAARRGACEPLICVRCMMRRAFGSKASRRCIVVRLSHSTRSPSAQR